MIPSHSGRDSFQSRYSFQLSCDAVVTSQSDSFAGPGGYCHRGKQRYWPSHLSGAVHSGADVAVVGRNPDRVAETVADIESRFARRAIALELDVRSPDDMEHMAQRTLEVFGRIDILVASAGILRPPGASLKTVLQTSAAVWDEVIGINLRGTFLSIRAVLPAMSAAKHGEIVTISSKAGRRGVAFDAPYSASKYGVIGLTESLAEEVRSQGIRVQAVVPGNFDSPVWKQNGPLAQPANLPPAERVADLIIRMISSPRDVGWLEPMIEPLHVPSRPDWFATRPTTVVTPTPETP